MYYCTFCDFKTENKNNINYHHIIPVELNGSNKKHNRVFLCPNCHSKIYIPNATNGPHSIKKTNSIIIKEWKNCTEYNRILFCHDVYGNALMFIEKL